MLVDIKTKIELLCWGVKSGRMTEHIFVEQNPYDHKRTGNVGIQLLIGESQLAANIPIGDRFTSASPYSLNEELKLFKNNRYVCDCVVVPPPSWYSEVLSDGTPIGKIFLQEGVSTLITAIYNGCDYFMTNQSCKFCAINLYGGKKYGVFRKSAQQIKEAFTLIKNDINGFTIDLTGGVTLTEDKGALMYIDVVKAIKEVVNIPICAEIAPPDDNKYLTELFEAGVDSFLINLEIWDDKLRQLFLPGKSLISKKRYFDVYEHAIKLVGSSKVSSVLIAGLESQYSTIEGATELINWGVIPTIMPFRPNDGSFLENFRVASPEDVYFISNHVAQRLIDKGLSPQIHPGCISCTACSSEADFFNHLSPFQKSE